MIRFDVMFTEREYLLFSYTWLRMMAFKAGS